MFGLFRCTFEHFAASLRPFTLCKRAFKLFFFLLLFLPADAYKGVVLCGSYDVTPSPQLSLGDVDAAWKGAK